jgi:anti-anti-sigma factor
LIIYLRWHSHCTPPLAEENNKINPIEESLMTTHYKIDGAMDAQTIGTLEDAFASLMLLENNIELDLEDVDFMDASGVGVIVYLYKKQIESELSLKLTNVTGQPARLLKYLRIDKVMTIEMQDMMYPSMPAIAAQDFTQTIGA